MVVSRLVALAISCAALAACERKAPGPEECRRFALAVFGLTREAELLGRAGREQVDELTRECLVVPYDRELLRCAEETGRLRACRRAFEMRQAGGSERMLVR